MKDKLNLEEIKRAIEDSKCQALITNNGIALCGNVIDLLALLAMFVNEMHKEVNISKEILIEVVNIGLKKDDELNKALQDSFIELLRKFNN